MRNIAKKISDILGLKFRSPLLSKNFPFVRENSPRRLYFPNQIPSSMQTKVDTKSIYINFHRPNIPFDNKEGREASLSHFSLIKPPTLVHCLKT